jgi:hypothetical protein
LKLRRIETGEVAAYERTVAAGITPVFEVPLLKIVTLTEGPESVTLAQIATAIYDDVITGTGNRSAIRRWLDYAETQFAGAINPQSVDDYWATMPPTATSRIRGWLRQAVVDNHSWPILFWHQHEFDRSVLESGTNL